MTLHNSLHNYCTIPILSDLHLIQQRILRHLNDFPGTVGSNIFRDLQEEFPETNRRTFYYHQKKLKDMGLIEELTQTKPFPLQLSWAGRQCVQLSSARVTDNRWVRLEKASVVFDLLEIYDGDLEQFKNTILLLGKWGRVANVTNNNWTKIIIKSRFPFFWEGPLNFDLVLNQSSVSTLVLAMVSQLKMLKIVPVIKLDILRIASKITSTVQAWSLLIKNSIGKELIPLQNLKPLQESMLKNESLSKMANSGSINPMPIQRWVFGPLSKLKDNLWFLINWMKFGMACKMFKTTSILWRNVLPTYSSSKSFWWRFFERRNRSNA